MILVFAFVCGPPHTQRIGQKINMMSHDFSESKHRRDRRTNRQHDFSESSLCCWKKEKATTADL